MMKRIAFNFAASSLVLGVTTVGCMMNGVGTGAAVAQSQVRSDPQAARFFEQASRAIADGKIDDARIALEQAVVLAPRDVGYRLLLADAYMKSGRFQSAEATYRDVLELDPSRTRAALSLALMQVANGRQQDAMAQLERLEGEASPADLGLAYALAGAPQRAVEILEPAARAMGATPRVRQNLALAYAFGGDWQRARTIAAQDVSPAELGDRMTSWASLAQRSGAPDQVAAMIGVNPVRDGGQPVQIALVRPAQIDSAAVRYASAQPMPTDAQVHVPVAAPAQPAVEAPAQVAFAAAVPAPAQQVVQAPARVAFTAAAPAPVQTEVEIPAPVAFAAAEPAVPAPAPVAVSAPVRIASVAAPPPPPVILTPPPAYAQAQSAADPAPVPVPVAAPAPAAQQTEVDYAELDAPEWGLDNSGNVQLPEEQSAEERLPAREQYAAAAETLVRPDPVVMPVASRAMRSVAPVAARVIRAIPSASRRSANGQYVVQIGAFSNAGNAERAWQQAERKFGLAAEQPVTMTIDINGRLLHRVAISGFEKRGEATQVCQSIRARGGECFVRGNAGDAANSWAARYAAGGSGRG